MFLTTIEDTPDGKYRGVITFHGNTVLRDLDAIEYPQEARESIEALFAKHLGAVLTHRIAEDLQAQADEARAAEPITLEVHDSTFGHKGGFDVVGD